FRDPEPPPPPPPAGELKPAEIAALRTRYEKELEEFYDRRQGGWGFRQKCSTPMVAEHAVLRFWGTGVPFWKKRVLFALDQQLAIMDPVWGGIYQYSTDGDWKHPHFEKLMTFQAP